MAASSIGAQMGTIFDVIPYLYALWCCLLGNAGSADKHLNSSTLLSITIPSTLLGILAIGIFQLVR